VTVDTEKDSRKKNVSSREAVDAICRGAAGLLDGHVSRGEPPSRSAIR